MQRHFSQHNYTGSHLAPDTDTEFGYAEFKQGILRVHIPKNAGVSRVADQQIIIY